MNKKASAIIRIIISSLLILTFISILLWGIERRGISLTPFYFDRQAKFANADKYKTGDASISADSLKELKIDWVDGEINVLPYDGQTIEIKETSSDSLSESEKLQYYFKNGTLIIQYQKSGFLSFGLRTHNKNLTVSIPSALCGNLNEVSIDTTSSDVRISGIHAESFDMETVSGNVDASDIETSQEFGSDTVSGNLNFSGNFKELDIETVSGDCTISSSSTPEDIQFDGVSGDFILQIPASSQFTLELDTMSGSFQNDFATNQKDDSYVCGNGSAQYDIQTVSGDVTICKS